MRAGTSTRLAEDEDMEEDDEGGVAAKENVVRSNAPTAAKRVERKNGWRRKFPIMTVRSVRNRGVAWAATDLPRDSPNLSKRHRIAYGPKGLGRLTRTLTAPEVTNPFSRIQLPFDDSARGQ